MILFSLQALIAFIFIAASYFLEYTQGLTPCLLCFFERCALIGVFIFALLTLLLSRRRFFAILCNLGCSFFIILGWFFSGRQVWLQHQPPSANYSCLPDVHYLLKTLPISQIAKLAYTGTPNCGLVEMRLTGLSLAEWALLAFFVLTIVNFFVYRVLKKSI